MKTKQPLTDMSGRWVLSTFEAFDTLLSRGYVAASPGSYSRKTKYLVIDNEGIHRYSDEVSLSIRFSEAYYHKGHFYDEPQDDTITEDKVPFPEREEILKISIVFSKYFETLTGHRNISIKTNDILSIVDYEAYKEAHEKGEDVKWELRQTDPHTDLKAKYEEALKVYDVVKVFINDKEYEISDVGNIVKYSYHPIELRFYNIDWNKVPSRTAVSVMSNRNYGTLLTGSFIGMDGDRHHVVRVVSHGYQSYTKCRLAPNVTIQDEWLVEVKL